MVNSQQSTVSNLYITIMAGGVGSRFWPASREEMPKQFLDIAGTGKSLIRMTVDRFLELVPASNIYVLTNEKYRDLVKEHIPELTNTQILGEPSRNNTAPCIAYAALKIGAINPNAVICVSPADAMIRKVDAFVDCIRTATSFAARQESIVTLGIEPNRPDTGYGYIQFEPSDEPVKKVLRFTEKPPLEQAIKYVSSGNYLWNAGIFVWSYRTIKSAFQANANEIWSILNAQPEVWNTEAETDFIKAAYPTTPSISVDYAIMENAKNVFTIPADIGWSDLGTWASLYAELPKSAAENVIQGDRILLQNTTNSLIKIPYGKLAVIRGLEDFIVIDEDDVLLIYPKNNEQEIKNVRQKLENLGLNDVL